MDPGGKRPVLRFPGWDRRCDALPGFSAGREGGNQGGIEPRRISFVPGLLRTNGKNTEM